MADPRCTSPTIKCDGHATMSKKRQAMLDLVERWMPTSVLNPQPGKRTTPAELKRAGWIQSRVPDLLELSHWDKATVAKMQAIKKSGGLVNTSCGDVLQCLLSLWGVDFDGDGKMTSRAFGIRDDGAYKDANGHWFNKKGKPPLGAITHGYYQKATEAFAQTPPILPMPGDVLVLRNGATLKATGVGHIGIIISVSDTIWVTADGGGGVLDNGDQKAEKSERPVTWTPPDATHPKGIPVLTSPTDGHKKLVDGWVILDKIPNPLYDKP